MTMKDSSKLASPNGIRVIENPSQHEILEYTKKTKNILACYQKGDFEKGLELSLKLVEEYSDKPSHTYLLVAWAYADLSKTEELLQTFEEGFSRGAWWGPLFLRESLGHLEQNPRFQKLIKLGEERFQEERPKSQAELILRTPKSFEKDNVYPILLVLPGRYGNNIDSEPLYYSLIEKKKIILAALQSSQVISGNYSTWDDIDRTFTDIKLAYKELEKRYSIDPEKFIISGISQGANSALMAIFSGIVPAKRFICTIPAFKRFYEQYKDNQTLDVIGQSLKGTIIAGEKDPRYEQTKDVCELLKTNGVKCQIYSYSDLNHDIPSDFNEVLLNSLNFILD